MPRYLFVSYGITPSFQKSSIPNFKVLLFLVKPEKYWIKKKEGVNCFSSTISNGHMLVGDKYIKAMWNKPKVFEIAVEYMIGKTRE